MVLPWAVFPYSLIQDPNFRYHMLLHASQIFISSPDHSSHKYPKAHWVPPQALKMQHIYPWKHAQFVPSCPTLCNPMDCSTPGSSVHRIFLARILEWVCHFLLQGVFPTQNQTHGWAAFPALQVDSSPWSHPGSHLHTPVSMVCSFSAFPLGEGYYHPPSWSNH